MPDEDEPEIDFVVGEGEWSADEVLPELPRREWPWLHRARGPLAVGAGFVVAIAVVATLISNQHDGTPSAAADPTPSAASPSVPDFTYLPTTQFTPVAVGSGGRFTVTVPASGVEIPVSGGRGLILRSEVVVSLDPSTGATPAPPDGPWPCPSGSSCLISSVVPADVLAAVRAVFPGARKRSAKNVLAKRDEAASHFWYRQVRARVGDLDILVWVDAAGSTDHPKGERIPAAGYARTTIKATSGDYTVHVEVDAPRGQAPPLGALRRLAADRRLVVDT